MYGCEIWTIKKNEEKMIQAFELWLSKRFLRVTWKQRKTNEWVRETNGVPEKEELLTMVKIRKTTKYDYWKRMETDR